MQLQEGIGRGGYRLLALVFAGLGVLGLVTTLAAFRQTDLEGLFKWLGFGLTAVALLTLLVLILVLLAPARQSGSKPGRSMEPEPEPEPLPEATGDDSNPDVEFAAEQMLPAIEPEPEPEPPTRGPPPRPQPPPPVFVHPPQHPRDTKGWPERKTRSGLTRGEAKAAEKAPATAEPKSAGASEPPLIMARTAASAEASGLPDNLSVGKCGNCGVLLLAPKKRPIRLQCPRCERVHTLA